MQSILSIIFFHVYYLMLLGSVSVVDMSIKTQKLSCNFDQTQVA